MKGCVIPRWSSNSSKKLKFGREFIVYDTEEENGREERKEINRGSRAHSIYLCFIPSHLCINTVVHVVALAIRELPDNIYMLYFINITCYFYIIQPQFLDYKPQVLWVPHLWR